VSDFAGLRIALSSLYAQRRGLEITGHNVANANTEGYSRQRVDLQALAPPTNGAFFATWEGSGQGVQVSQFVRFRDTFLEVRAALEHGAEAHLSTVRHALDQLEQLFDEPGDLGIQRSMSELWSGFDDVANHPGDDASRQQLLERVGTLATTINHAANQITSMRDGAVDQLEATVAQVNTMAETVNQLNDAIKRALTSGVNANDLADQRDLIVEKLASSVGATVRPGEWGAVNLFLNGTALVNAGQAERLMVDETGPTVVVRWEKDNFPATITGGDAGGLLEVVNVKLVDYLSDLDTIALQLRDDVNSVHGGLGGSIAAADRDQSAAGNLDFQVALNGGGFATVSVAGADWSGAGGAAALQASLQAAVDGAIGAGNATVSVSGVSGQPLAVSMTATGTNVLQAKAVTANAGFATLLGSTAVGLDGVGGRRIFEGTGASDLAVSDDITDPNQIAAGAVGAGALDGSIALQLAELASSTTGADSLYRSYIVGLGVDSQTTQHRHDIQSQTMGQVDNARNALSGVNIDEEMVNMVQFQHAYDAAARFMTSVDEMLDTLINRTGVVGR
jgi:flagellar hook-associated protein FlgK